MLDGSFRVRLVNVRPKVASNSPLQTGEFLFKEAVLEQLPRYFRYIDLMRKVDPDAYAMFSRVGASILPSDRNLSTADCNFAGEHFSVDRIPSFGCVYINLDERAESDPHNVYPDFIWWTKLAGAHGVRLGVEASPSDVFTVTALYHDRFDELGSVTFHIAVPSFEEARVLKEQVLNESAMYDHRSQVGRRSYSLRRREWSYPTGLKMIGNSRGLSPQEAGRSVFAVVTTSVMSRRSGFQVRVAQAGRYAVFNVDEGAGPAFFADRDIQVNENGRKKRIFHYVAGYQKTDGTMVAGHTKGLREFDWNGYSVHIGKPDFDFANIDRMTAPAEVEGDPEPQERRLTMAELGVLVQRHIRQSAWRRRKKR